MNQFKVMKFGGTSMAAGERDKAKEQIGKLEAHYQSFIRELVKGPAFLARAKAIVAEHFEFLTIILRISFSEALSKDILAQGELLSTKLFSLLIPSAHKTATLQLLNKGLFDMS
jgi:aspartate kinase